MSAVYVLCAYCFARCVDVTVTVRALSSNGRAPACMREVGGSIPQCPLYEKHAANLYLSVERIFSSRLLLQIPPENPCLCVNCGLCGVMIVLSDSNHPERITVDLWVG